MLNVCLGAPTLSLTNVRGSLSPGQNSLQVTAGGSVITKRMLHNVHMELSSVSLCGVF